SELREEFESLDAVDFRRYWWFSLTTRVRYHLGSAAWHVSFGDWPVSLALDRALLGVVTAMPIAALSERRMQTELMVRKFPRLAALPLDRNSEDDAPLIRTARAHLRAALRARLAPAGRWLGPRRERRYYYRTFDFDGDGWRRVREAAEPYRGRCDALVDRATLDALLPPPGQRLQVADGIIGSAGPKLLLGLVMWAATREAQRVPGPLPSPGLNAAATFVR
ncbi:MAG TPA: hypothetical protein VFY16_07895, partial [Gemmatimonadaceae bacterium]|nr:hypothetical protein [Gemmatimonadaceae bacterium]